MPIQPSALRAAGERTPGKAPRADASRSKRELYAEAKNAGIEGRSAMSKEELIQALGRQRETTPPRAADPRRPDRCAIVYHRDGRHGEFHVVVTEANGSRKSVARSPAFRAPRIGPVRRRRAARAAHDLLVRRLEACGWWPAGSSRKWYELGFVRLRTAGMGSVRSLVAVVRDGSQARFVAEELDTYGNPTPLLVSASFSARRARAVRPSREAKLALKQLVVRMEREGWDIAEAVGEEWYAFSMSRYPVAAA
jgi:hypothetical protein